jgi:3-oxoacyl-[acyl-carrier protein] reductase
VALHYNSDQDGALALQDEFKEAYVRNFGSKFVAYKADLEDWDEVGFLFSSQSIPYKDKRSVLGQSCWRTTQVRELHEHIVSILGPPTILINNAGSTDGLTGVKSADQVSMDVFERTWRINCGSAYLLTQLCLPAMEGEGWGRVVFVSSVAGITGGIIGPHYAWVVMLCKI